MEKLSSRETWGCNRIHSLDNVAAKVDELVAWVNAHDAGVQESLDSTESLLQSVRMFRSEDGYEFPGRGFVFIVDVGDNPLPRPGAAVRIDNIAYTVIKGVESRGGRGSKAGLLVEKREA